MKTVLRAGSALFLAVLAACSGDKVTGTDSEQGKVKTGSLLVTTSGLPNGIAPSLKLQRAATSRDIAAGTAQSGVEVGEYTLVANVVTADGFSYDPEPGAQAVSITNNKQTSTSVSYKRRVGTVNVTVGGLPSGANSAIILTPPVGSNIAVTGTVQLTNQAPGNWRMNASPVVVGGFSWTPTPAVEEGALAAGSTRNFSVQYAVSTGAMAVAVTGLPQGVTSTVNITGPNGYAKTINSTLTITDLAPGTYTVNASNVLIAGVTYAPNPAMQQVEVSASTVAAPANITYGAFGATLALGVMNAPAGATDFVHVSGPSGYSRTLSGSTKLENLVPGTYTVTASNATTILGTWKPTPVTAQRTIAAGAKDSVGVTYAIATGSLAIAVTGAPGGLANVTVTGPGGYNKSVASTQTLLALTPGTYTVSASNITSGGTTYAASPASQQVNVVASVQAAGATVTYTQQGSTGGVAVAINGLPNGVDAQVTLTGPSTSVQVTSSQTLSGLAAGSYTLAASNVTSGGNSYQPVPLSQNVVIAAGETTNATVTYSVVESNEDDLSIAFAYVTQATQKQDGSVTLVANRDALLRVFVVNNRSNSLTPTVRARIYQNATLLQTATINAPESSVRTTTAEGVLGSSWNLAIDAANVRTGMRILVDVDPTDAIDESSESNNAWPQNGTPNAVTVVSVPAFNVRMIPVTVNGQTGNLTEANKENYLRSLRRMFPVNEVNAEVRPTFTSTASTLQASGTNWQTVLEDLADLRAAEGSSAHYYGVVKVGYSSGVAGLGYVGWPAAMGWDHMPSGDETAAHEWGHNFNRPHSPCGGPAGPDPSYPYSGGAIGSYGWNFALGTLLQATAPDIMGYCPNKWISDYTWTKVMTYRQGTGLSVANSVAKSQSANGGLMVSATVTNGQITLRPAFRVDAGATSDLAGATHRVEALDRDGRVIAQASAIAHRIDHAARDVRSFSVVLPWSETLERSLVSIRVRDLRSPLATVTASSVVAEQQIDRNTPPVLPEPDGVVEHTSANTAKVRWNTTVFKAAMVKDAATGHVIAFVRRSGDEIVARSGRTLEVVYSDGVRSVEKRH